MIIADTSALLAFWNPAEDGHESVLSFLGSNTEDLVVSPYVIGELDYLVAPRLGIDQELAMIEELSVGAYLLADFAAEDLGTAHSIIARYRDQNIGVTDASLVVLADRYRTRTILTLDRQHFDVLRPLTGGRFKVIP